MTRRTRIHIGTSGWHCDDRLRTGEFNNTFCRTPGKETLAAMHQTSPAGFAFAVKAIRFVTRMKKIKDPERTLREFLEALPGGFRHAFEFRDPGWMRMPPIRAGSWPL